MLTLDTSQRAFHAAKKHQEQQREKVRAAVAEARAKEEAAFAPDGDHATTTLEAQLGRPMTHTEVQKRIHKLNENLICMQAKANPDGIGIYIRDAAANKGTQYSGIRYTGISFEKGYLPEFDVHHVVEEEFWNESTQKVDKRAILDPKHPLTRGWWTLLLRLVKGGYVEKAAALRVFSKTPSRSSKKWRDTLG